MRPEKILAEYRERMAKRNGDAQVTAYEKQKLSLVVPNRFSAP
jgi:hypothetical protein